MQAVANTFFGNPACLWPGQRLLTLRTDEDEADELELLPELPEITDECELKEMDAVPAIPDEPAEEALSQEKTLRQIMDAAIKKNEASFSFGEPSAAGSYNCLKRAAALQGPVRRFCRFVRLEEGVLSEALLERDSLGTNAWNCTEHQLALARRVASLDQQRMSRASLWLQKQADLVKKVAGKVAVPVEGLPGLRKADEFRPPVPGQLYSMFFGLN